MALTRVNPKKPGLPSEIGPFRVMSFDPGGTTGIAIASFEGGYLTSYADIEFSSWEIGPFEHHSDLWDEIDRNCPSRLVCESFEFRQHIDKDKAKMKVELISREYIGIVRLYAARYDIPLSMHTASAAKGLIPDKGPQKDVKLKQLGWNNSSPGNHANDAARHLVYYLVRKAHPSIREVILKVWLKS